MKRLAALVLCLVSLCSIACAEQLDEKTLLSYYDDCLFIGDSIMQGLRRYRSAVREEDPSFLESATIVCTASISLYSGSRRFLNGEYHFKYKGIDQTMYEIARTVKPKRVLVLLGLNDPVGIKIDRAMEWIEYIVRTLPGYAPDTELCFFSQTPITERYCRMKKRPGYQDKLNEYNARLRETCERLGVTYIEISESLKGEDGYLVDEYSSDKICHLSDEGLAVWVRDMCAHAQRQYDAGLWKPFAEETPDDESSSAEAPEAVEDTAPAEPSEPAATLTITMQED